MDLTELFCDVDDFVKAFDKRNLPVAITSGKPKRGTVPRMSLSELMTIIIAYHSSGFKNFKTYYFYLREQMGSEFPKILSYSRFIEWKPYCLIPIFFYLKVTWASSRLLTFRQECLTYSSCFSIQKNIKYSSITISLTCEKDITHWPC